jgi:hypothetical protein
MEILSETEEYDIFNTDAMQNYIEFKWNRVGRNHHAFGAMLHVIYLGYLCYYINDVYIKAGFQGRFDKDPFARNYESLLFILAVLYPLCYESM